VEWTVKGFGDGIQYGCYLDGREFLPLRAGQAGRSGAERRGQERGRLEAVVNLGVEFLSATGRGLRPPFI
jgi:hypothetical protein